MFKIIIIILAAVSILMVIIDRYFIYQRNKISDNYVNEISNGNFKKAYAIENDKKALKFIPPFNRNLLCFNTALIENNSKKIIEYFDTLDKYNLGQNQKKSLYIPALQYFISIKDIERCKICIKKLETLKMDQETREYLEEINSIIILKKTDLLDVLLERIKCKNPTEIYSDEFLISEIYSNLGNVELSKKYFNLGQKHMDEFFCSKSK